MSLKLSISSKSKLFSFSNFKAFAVIFFLELFKDLFLNLTSLVFFWSKIFLSVVTIPIKSPTFTNSPFLIEILFIIPLYSELKSIAVLVVSKVNNFCDLSLKLRLF